MCFACKPSSSRPRGRTYTVCRKSLSRILKRNFPRQECTRRSRKTGETRPGKTRRRTRGSTFAPDTSNPLRRVERPQQVARRSADLTVNAIYATDGALPLRFDKNDSENVFVVCAGWRTHSKSGQNFGRTPYTRLFLPNRRRQDSVVTTTIHDDYDIVSPSSNTCPRRPSERHVGVGGFRRMSRRNKNVLLKKIFPTVPGRVPYDRSDSERFTSTTYAIVLCTRRERGNVYNGIIRRVSDGKLLPTRRTVDRSNRRI